MSFRLEKEDGRARAGVLTTGHGDVPTPMFMPVATAGTTQPIDNAKANSAKDRPAPWPERSSENVLLRFNQHLHHGY